ncbi:MAG: type I-C CRISPR-associated protein Cas5c [Bryobacteraceae bacterium]
MKVFGDYACFSRPEFKVERVSYRVITPSAARGVLEAVFWKPEFRYQIREVRVLRMGTETAILRNELSHRQGAAPIFVEAEGQRQQRTSLILKDVSYAIRAEIAIRAYAVGEPGKYLDQFRRSVEKGQCHHTPCLGTREFSAHFEPVDGELADEQLRDRSLDLGQMLFDIAYIEGRPEKGKPLQFWRATPEGQKLVEGYADPIFFHARIEDGLLRVPMEKYVELYKREAGNA